jgi:hypothetical protein
MGRPVRIRSGGYASDVTALSRLALALKSDKRVPQTRLKRLVKLLDEAVNELIGVDRSLGFSRLEGRSSASKAPAA